MQKAWLNIASGAGLGVLMGFLLGLSSSSVVGGVVAALAATLAAFFGLGPQIVGTGISELRVASFGVFAAGALILGIEARTHNWLSYTPKEQVDAWVEAGLGRPEAINTIASREFGVSVQGGPASAPSKPSIQDTVLFSSTSSDCDELDRSRFATPERRRDAFMRLGNNWAAAAKAAGAETGPNLARVLDGAYALACSRGLK